jgi:hypothetical protein
VAEYATDPGSADKAPIGIAGLCNGLTTSQNHAGTTFRRGVVDEPPHGLSLILATGWIPSFAPLLAMRDLRAVFV